MFCTFPSGSPGLGLLLLRGFVALTLIAQGVTHLASRDSDPLSWLVAVFIFLSASCLLIGFLTPVVAVVTGLAAIALVTLGLPFPIGTFAGRIVLATVIALLGPGAFSVDSRLFGRREILIPTSRSRM